MPNGVTTRTLCGFPFPVPPPPLEIAKTAVIDVALLTVKLLTVTPVPDTVTAVAPVRLVPVRATVMLLPRWRNVEELGAIELRVGALLTTVKVT